MSAGASPNLILTGFMGTGKTAVGREAARRLGRPFVDMDAEIEARAGKSIPRIFAEFGEATFRQQEAALCEELSARQGLVIATGGGALVNPANRALMMSSGNLVCLTCAVEEILERARVDDSADRPLLNVSDPRAEIERLLEARRAAYAAIPWQIDTTGLSIGAVTTRVIQFADVVTLPVRYPGTMLGQEPDAPLRGDWQNTYPIHIGQGLLAHLGGALRAAGVTEGERVAIVSNPVVAPLYGDQVETALQTARLEPFTCSIPDGERHKTLATLSDLYDQLLDGGLDRSGTVLALGGGVTGDVAGFAAASFMRGVRFVQVPTTLLAMVDASVGGKTGVDLSQGKNLVGAFKQPALVLIDPGVLATLPAEERRSGMAEVIKHGVIGAPDLFAELEAASHNTQSPALVTHLHLSPQLQVAGASGRCKWQAQVAGASDPIPNTQLARALRVKIEIVEHDPFEGGRRAVLNLGHTVGHALEQLSGFALRHGEAVAIGMVAAARIAQELGRAAPSLSHRISSVLEAWGLPTRCPPYEADSIWQALAHDKKRKGHNLRWVLPHAIGHVEIVTDVPPQVVKSVLHSLGARSRT